MNNLTFLILLGFILLSVAVFFVGRKKLQILDSKGKKLHSLPVQYGYLYAVISLFPLFIALFVQILFTILDISFSFNASLLWAFSISIVLFFLSSQTITNSTKARDILESIIKYIFLLCATISILTTFAILLSILLEAIEFFEANSIWYFITGTTWSPGDAFLESTGRLAEGVDSGAKFGSVPLFAGTFMITLIAMLVAIPFGILSAIYLAEYAKNSTRAWLKPLIEILAGIPTIEYGFFAAITIAPMVVNFFSYFGLEVSYNNALSSGVIMGVMITPIVMSLSEDAIRSVPDTLRQAAAGLGILKTEAITSIILPTALPGIIAAIILGFSRAIGETMIVVMEAGLRPNITINPLEDMTTVTVRIVDALTGDHSFDSAETLSVFALGLVLFIFTVCLNALSLSIMRSFSRKYRLQG